MAENTKTPPNQDQRQRTPQGDPSKPQKPGGSMPSNPDRSRQGVNNPKPEIDPDRDRQNRGKPVPPGKDGVVDVDDIEDDDATQRMDRD